MRYVGNSGDPMSNIWLVGEAPGEQEVSEGKPFVGSSGMLLRKLCLQAGLNVFDCFITNVCHYRPPDNEIDAWVKKTKALPADWARVDGLCAAPPVLEGIRELQRMVNKYKPRQVIALGKIATWALTGKWGIEQWRGSILPCSFEPETKVVPTYHPAYLLRNFEKYPDVVVDIRRAKQQSLFPGIRRPEFNYVVHPSLEQVLAYLADLPPVVTVDIETSARQIRCIGIGRGRWDAICIPIFTSTKSYWTKDEELIVVEAIRDALLSREVVGQNFLYDLYYLAMCWGLQPKLKFDTMIAQGVLFPGAPKSLDYLASIYADYYCYWKKDHKEWKEAQDDQLLWVYNCTDCCYTWQVWEALETLLDTMNQRAQFDFVMRLIEPIHEIMLRGLRVDTTRLEELGQMIDKRMDQAKDFLNFVFGHEVAPHNTHQLKKLFYEDLRLPVIISRKTGSPSVDKEALDKLANKEPLLIPVVDTIKNLRTLNILKTSVVDSVARDGRLYTSLNPVGTVTFRFSSTENPMGLGTNLQNIAKKEEDESDDLPDVRRVIIPDPDRVLMEFDLSKADLRVVVWESEEEELKEALRAGINIYKDIAADVVRMPYRRAKMFVHGTNYGGKPRTMAVNCGITVHEAEVAQKRWFDKFAGIKRWHQRVEEELRRHRRVSNKFGFRMLFLGRVDGKLPEALAWCPQSTVAIVINHVLQAIPPWIERLMQVHDSILVQVQPDQVQTAYKEVMAEFNKVVIPYDDPLIIPAECKISASSWGEIKEFHG